ncbi:Uncharacterized protein HZ326_19029, partial [Fusarium oxysporum f. sp. albedinis]
MMTIEQPLGSHDVDVHPKISLPISTFPRLSSTFSFWSDPEDAARSLRRDGWIDVKTDIETDLERCPFVHSSTIQYLCLDPTAVE